MMSRVEAEPLLITDSSEARWPSTRTTLVCGGEPLRTLATSRMKIGTPLTVLIGRSFSSATVSGLLFIRTSYSMPPIFDVPPGRIRFCWLTALTTSVGDSPLAWSALVSRSTWICGCLPPYAFGIDAPCTVASWTRRKLTPRS